MMMLWHDNDCDSVKSATFCAGCGNLTFPRSVAKLRNVIASDQEVCCYNYIENTLLKNNFKVEERRNSDGELIVGDTVTNALFHFSR